MSATLPGSFRAAVLLSCVFSAVGCVSAQIQDFNNHAVLGNPDKLMAFVGEKVRVVEYDQSEDFAEDVIFLPMDVGFKARYRILELVHGEFSGDTVDFKAYDHYGNPNFARHDVVMLYLAEHDGELFHVKYEYDRVYPTADGRFAGCGDPFFSYSSDPRVDGRLLQKISFTPPVVLRISDYRYSAEGNSDYERKMAAENRARLNSYFTPPVFKVEGDRAICQMGLYPDELFRVKNELQFLPIRRRRNCLENLGLDIPRGPAQEQALEACIAEMKENNLP